MFGREERGKKVEVEEEKRSLETKTLFISLINVKFK